MSTKKTTKANSSMKLSKQTLIIIGGTLLVVLALLVFKFNDNSKNAPLKSENSVSPTNVKKNSVDESLLRNNVFYSPVISPQRGLNEKVQFTLNIPNGWNVIRAQKFEDIYNLELEKQGSKLGFGSGSLEGGTCLFNSNEKKDWPGIAHIEEYDEIKTSFGTVRVGRNESRVDIHEDGKDEILYTVCQWTAYTGQTNYWSTDTRVGTIGLYADQRHTNAFQELKDIISSIKVTK